MNKKCALILLGNKSFIPQHEFQEMQHIAL